MIRETNAPKSYIHKTEYEKTVNVAKLHKGKPIRRITHTNDIYPVIVPPKRHRGRKTRDNYIDRINRLMKFMCKREKATVDEMEGAIKFNLRKTCSGIELECSVRYLVKNGYIEQVDRPGRGRKATYRAIRKDY